MDLDQFARGRRAFFLLGLLALALFFPGLAKLPVTDRDEARFAQATRQMVETGDYVNIRFQDQARRKKPVGIHWLQAASVRLAAAGDTGAIWAYRLPSALGAAAAVLALFALARPILGAAPAFLGAVILAGALITVIEAHIAKTDAVLLLCTVAAQGALMGIYTRSRDSTEVPPALSYLFWAALGAGVLIKGPVLPMIAVLTLATLGLADRRTVGVGRLWRGLRPLSGIVLCIAIAAPWFIAITLEDSRFLTTAVSGDLLPKLLGGQESHGAPPGFYLALAPITFWPGVLLVPFGLIWAWRHRAEPATRFCLAWLIPAWIVFELVPTKLVHYVLPLYPAAALLAAKAAVDGGDWLATVLRRWPAWVWLFLWVLAGLAIAALLPLAAALRDGWIPFAAWWGAAAAFIILCIGAGAWALKKPVPAVMGAAAALVLFTGIAFAVALPGLRFLWPSEAARTMVQAARPSAEAPIAVAGYREPSVVFVLGTETVLTSPQGAARRLATEPGALALIERRTEAKFRTAARGFRVTVESLGAIHGFNIAKGQTVTLTLYRARQARP